jgi:hypothetical protein
MRLREEIELNRIKTNNLYLKIFCLSKNIVLKVLSKQLSTTTVPIRLSSVLRYLLVTIKSIRGFCDLLTKLRV